MKATFAGLILVLLTVAGAAVPGPASAQHPGHFIASPNQDLPSNVDPRFGIISFRPDFGQREFTHPAFKPQPFPPQPIFFEPTVIFVPGHWWWSGWNWVWVSPHWRR